MCSVTFSKLYERLMKQQHIRFYAHQTPSVKTKKLKQFVPSLGASGESSVNTVVETKINDLTISAAKERWLYRALNPGPGRISFMKIHQELMKGYKNVYILPNKVQLGKTRLLTMKQLDQVLTTSSLLVCVPLVYLYYIREHAAEVYVPNHDPNVVK